MELNFKVPVEEAIELGVRETFKYCGQEEIQRKLAADIFENNVSATKTYFEKRRKKNTLR